MDFRNATELDSERLHAMLVRHTEPYRHSRLVVRVRYSRGAEFSGTCYYREGRIFVNLGRQVRYPYPLATEIARAKTRRGYWWRETYRVTLFDAYQLVLFVYLHELYHYLVMQARRNPRRKEAMCDRFATRVLVDHYGCPVTDAAGRPVPRETWDFKDLHAFVAAAPRGAPRVRVAKAAKAVKPVESPLPRPVPVQRVIPVTVRGLSGAAARTPLPGEQLRLFEE